MGDYLDVNGNSPLGEELNSLCGLGGKGNFFEPIYLCSYDTFTAEPAVFSCRIQLLVSKFGRSSKPMPRFLVLVRFHYIIMTVY
jgi:myosin-1